MSVFSSLRLVLAGSLGTLSLLLLLLGGVLSLSPTAPPLSQSGSVSLHVPPFLCAFIFLPLSLPVCPWSLPYLALCLNLNFYFMYLYIFLCLSLYLSACLSVCLSVYVCLCCSISPSVSPCLLLCLSPTCLPRSRPSLFQPGSVPLPGVPHRHKSLNQRFPPLRKLSQHYGRRRSRGSWLQLVRGFASPCPPPQLACLSPPCWFSPQGTRRRGASVFTC